MNLHELQSLHVGYTALLIQFALSKGYELTWGQTIRTQAEANANAAAGSGISKSLHTIGLAIDLNLFKDGKFLTASDDHRPLGDYWKTLNPLCCWGGDFRPKPDGNHYSITFEDRK